MNPLYMHLHIPRTGGTFLQNAIGHYLDRTNDNYLRHYHYLEHHTNKEYDEAIIPKLRHRTKQQQNQIKVLTGHSISCNSHKWLKEHREPYIFTTVRDPIDRLLSSFNYRHMLATLSQDPESFSHSMPSLDRHAQTQDKTATDYDTLWEYYQDSSFERNLQCKWIIKSFVKKIDDVWYKHPVYESGADVSIHLETTSHTWPEWMNYDNTDTNWFDMDTDTNWFDMAKSFFPNIWWIGQTENLETDIKDFCNYIGINYVPNAKKNQSKTKTHHQYWTREDVMKQHDIDKLIQAEKYDFKLIETVKKWKRPF
jgi:hypothetical protein